MKLIVLLVMIFSSIFAVVEINSADAKSFTELNGVGPKKSKAIVKYRNVNGCFSSIGALKKVKGIGPKTIERNRDKMVLCRCNN